ncbi:MAG: FAD-dependent oxidoreductase [Rubripirellula sp.]
MPFRLSCSLLAMLVVGTFAPAAEVFVEAESFSDHGGWKLDTQFVQQMGSPYLIAHGLGKPVDDAAAKVTIPENGQYRVWVRTIDWVARWNAKPSPGKFKLILDGEPLAATFGTEGADWFWHDGGIVSLQAGETEIRLHDETGFDGRCDSVYLTTDLDAKPPTDRETLLSWRRGQLGLPDKLPVRGAYDLVVVGGGYAGMGSAISAARMGCRVALVQDRPVLGGNGSSEVRVWAMGNIRRGKYPRIGEMVEEFADKARKSPGTYEEFGDELKEQIVLAEPNIDLMLNHHAMSVRMDGSKIASITAIDTRTGSDVEITGDFFVDCTGHGWVGHWANADLDMTDAGRMGMSNMWAWDEAESATSFPSTPWALDLNMEDFPYPRDHHGQWFWESGFDKDAIGGAEAIRDWNLRAVYGAFNAMKNRDGADQHKTAELTWVAYIGGPRESRRLLGDVVLTEEDIVTKRDFPDGCVPSTWSIDLHYPKKEYADKFPDNPFISVAVHDRRVDRSYGYPVPYRCFYSRNVDNLFMAGRNISVTHQALGTTRVMKTCGMMGEVVGKAASICTLNQCSPRDVYEKYLDELLGLLELPGKARRSTPSADVIIPDDAMQKAGPNGPPPGHDPANLEGTVVDDANAKLTGSWTEGSGLKGFVGYGYRYASPNSDATATFTIRPKASGKAELRFYTQPHENRSSKTQVTVRQGDMARAYTIDQRETLDADWIAVGQLSVKEGQDVIVVVNTDAADGFVHVDAVSLVEVK